MLFQLAIYFYWLVEGGWRKAVEEPRIKQKIARCSWMLSKKRAPSSGRRLPSPTSPHKWPCESCGGLEVAPEPTTKKSRRVAPSMGLFSYCNSRTHLRLRSRHNMMVCLNEYIVFLSVQASVHVLRERLERKKNQTRRASQNTGDNRALYVSAVKASRVLF